MTNNTTVQRSRLAFVGALGALLLALTVIAFAQGPIVLGQPGVMSGVLTLKPPDASGWYHLDNPGNQQLRFSGGGRPGQFLYMTISHPGRVTIHGDLEVTGVIHAASQPPPLVRAPTPSTVRPSLPPMQPIRSSSGSSDAKADSGNTARDLQRKLDELTTKVNELVTRINALSR